METYIKRFKKANGIRIIIGLNGLKKLINLFITNKRK